MECKNCGSNFRTIKQRVCSEPIKIQCMIEISIYSSRVCYPKIWVVGETKVINSQNKPKPKEKKILTDFSKQDEDEVI